jgi:hypothetical protein
MKSTFELEKTRCDSCRAATASPPPAEAIGGRRSCAGGDCPGPAALLCELGLGHESGRRVGSRVALLDLSTAREPKTGKASSLEPRPSRWDPTWGSFALNLTFYLVGWLACLAGNRPPPGYLYSPPVVLAVLIWLLFFAGLLMARPKGPLFTREDLAPALRALVFNGLLFGGIFGICSWLRWHPLVGVLSSAALIAFAGIPLFSLNTYRSRAELKD